MADRDPKPIRVKNPLIIALDVDDLRVAQKLFHDLKNHVGGFKIGPRITFRADKSFLEDLSNSGILFFDHKFFDIPSTMVASIRTAAELGAHWVTVHALSGSLALSEMATLELEIKKTNPNFRVLSVTVLTSFTQETLPPIWNQMTMGESVQALAANSANAGLLSFVCSSEEIKSLKEEFPNSFLVVPGIRPAGASTHDQKRVATPTEAIKSGASALVIGRAVIEAKSPLDSVKKILESLFL